MDNKGNPISIPVVQLTVIDDFNILDKIKKFKEIIDMLILDAQEIMNNHHNLPPAIFFVMENGEIWMMEIGQYLQNDDTKEELSAIIKSLIQERKDPNIYGIIMITEAWLATTPLDKANSSEPIGPVSERKDKIEVIMVNAQTKEFCSLTQIPYVKIDTDMIIFEKPTTNEMDDIKGKFSFFK